jgi:hypothetical protein
MSSFSPIHKALSAKGRAILRSARACLVFMLVALPAVARPPHAPDDQYEGFDKDDVLIIDKQTKLSWERNIRLTPVAFTAADNYCTIQWSPGGGRLPTIKELLTIFDELPHVEYNGQNVNVYIDEDAFGASRTPISAPYWSSTPVINESGPTGEVWTLDFGTGRMEKRLKSATAFSRCVKNVL